MAATNVAVLTASTVFNSDYTHWKIYASFISSANTDSITTVEYGDDGSVATLANLTAAIATDLSIAPTDVTYVPPTTL